MSVFSFVIKWRWFQNNPDMLMSLAGEFSFLYSFFSVANIFRFVLNIMMSFLNQCTSLTIPISLLTLVPTLIYIALCGNIIWNRETASDDTIWGNLLNFSLNFCKEIPKKNRLSVMAVTACDMLEPYVFKFTKGRLKFNIATPNSTLIFQIHANTSLNN